MGKLLPLDFRYYKKIHYNFIKTIKILKKKNINFILCGGFASSLVTGGISRHHKDIEICMYKKDIISFKKNILTYKYDILNFEFRNNFFYFSNKFDIEKPKAIVPKIYSGKTITKNINVDLFCEVGTIEDNVVIGNFVNVIYHSYNIKCFNASTIIANMLRFALRKYKEAEISDLILLSKKINNYDLEKIYKNSLYIKKIKLKMKFISFLKNIKIPKPRNMRLDLFDIYYFFIDIFYGFNIYKITKRSSNRKHAFNFVMGKVGSSIKYIF